MYGERLGVLLGRRVEEVEGAVAVAMALVERNGVELREELRAQTESLTEQLESVAALARAAAAAAEEAHDPYTVHVSLDEVHQRIDALTRELRTVSRERPAGAAPGGPYVGRLALTLGRRLATVEGALELATARAERITNDVRGEVAEIAKTSERRETELVDRLEQVERDRDAMAAQLLRGAESWGSERAALQERVAELAARIVTGPVPDAPAAGDGEAWPSPRAFDQLRIAVEGLRMRLAYHEKEVAEIVGGRSVDQRIDEMHHLMRRLESAEESVREERDTVLEQLDRVASRMDYRLQQLEVPAPGREP
jgi:DNA-binding ferritin-like protein